MLAQKGQMTFVIKTIVSFLGLGIVLMIAVPGASYATDAINAIAGSSGSGEIGSPAPGAPEIQTETRELAERILKCNEPDPTRGAKFFVGTTAFPSADEDHDRYMPPTEAADGYVDFFAGESPSDEIEIINEKLNSDEYKDDVIDALTIEVDGTRYYTAWWANYKLDKLDITNNPRERICIENGNPDSVRFYKEDGDGSQKQCGTGSNPDPPVKNPTVCDSLLENTEQSSLTDIDENKKHLAVIIENEGGYFADSVSTNMRRAIGYTVLHRMAERGTKRVKDVACAYDGWIKYYNAGPDGTGYCQRSVG